MTLPAGVYRIDPVHTFAVFSVRHLMVGRVDGRFNTIAGELVVIDDPERPFDQVAVSIDSASLDTQVGARDEDLRSARFFHVGAFPRLTFEGRSADPGPDSGSVIAGNLTIRDVTRPVMFDVTVRGVTTDPHGHTRLGATATAALRRRDFGLTTEIEQESGDSVDPDIQVRLDVEAVLD